LLGDPTKAREILGWRPTVTFPELVRLLVAADLQDEGLEPARLMTASVGPVTP